MAKRPNQSSLARQLGITPGRVSQLAKAGMPIYSVDAARAWRAQHVAPMPTAQPQAAALRDERLDDDQDAGPAPAGYLESRARREAAEAAISEMRQSELAGELIRVAAVEATWSAALAGMREHLLQIPGRLGPQLAALSDPAAVITALEKEVSAALHSLAAHDASGPGASTPA